MAQIINRGPNKYLIRIPLGSDEIGKRHFYNETVNKSYTQAVKYARSLEYKRDMGENIEPSRATLEQYLIEWLAIIKPRIAARTYRSYKSLLDTHVIPIIGWKRIGYLSPLDLETVYSGMEADKKSSRTIQYTHSVLSSALRQAVMWKLITHNPALDTDKRTRRRTRRMRISPFTESELSAFLKHAAADPYYLVFLVAVTSGLRPEEYLGLAWKHFDEKKGTLKVEQVLVRDTDEYIFAEPKTKNGRRTVPIPQVTVKALTELKREQRRRQIKTLGYANHGLIFAGATGEPLDENNLRRRHFHKILTAAKLEQRRLYDCRHTWVTLCLAAGADPKAVSEWAGHASVAFTLDTYQHLIPSVAQKTSATIEALFSR